MSYITDLENHAKNGIYRREGIESWLLKYSLKFERVRNEIETLHKEFPDAYIRSHPKLENEAKFLDTYEVLLEIIDCYINEIYYKGQIEFYNRIKYEKAELVSWLWMHKFDEGKMQSTFNKLFQNTSTSSGYEFIIKYPFSLPVTIMLDESDFKYTLHFMDILKN